MHRSAGGVAVRARPRPARASSEHTRPHLMSPPERLHRHPMVKPERRTRADVVAAIAIAVVIAVTAGLVWLTSDARATISRPAADRGSALATAKAVPSSLRQLWTAHSPKTRAPLVVAASVVTGDGHTVEGRDPVSGSPLWSYGRRPRTVRCQLGVPVRRRGLSRQPRLRSGQHDRRQDRQARSGPHRLRRPRGTAVIGRHRGSVGRGQPARAVAV